MTFDFNHNINKLTYFLRRDFLNLKLDPLINNTLSEPPLNAQQQQPPSLLSLFTSYKLK